MESFEQVTDQYTPMIYKIISSLSIYTNKDEFFQVGLIALWEAYERFDAEKGIFTSFAYAYIRGRLQTEMTRMNRHADKTVHVQEKFLEDIEDDFNFCTMDEDILLSYCQAGKLTENQTKWVLYTFLKELTVSEIAAIEQVSLSAVKNWRTGAKEKLRIANTIL
ncbi:sigma-70 family RNA polymerase sigma factor [Bacillus sp. DTU_2020_1000418_1_SI_GHA_SEK_038]|uniref:sigma-70 family RNA polymerase sigma factor n=1 Tax=Bacillus sp. DTU_2020_1000418_1_SI_GHA_SEK_038 TaxID=3077585 RepID=UPI0028E6F125|nr:sigma-70 family RNA polymerase sigma factor [Bacillus sp. DTU_2020_1000418_1_SI_GHA_SEK_038]WNS75190.1 sigma-70 family RNA polymerase sigma factor [Bacillus sp. DTU_2020_1000418_1_SI_GHA_SEK_038]